eukprot:comp7229_c1_seq1/m.2942 comp7229_c1_seq1/g.2942  ORF comp7229_c1_seq1/g.2942 comp7229_c1_seq1/m.2942 type:complete len:245 (-) comp7229_c1_seq1:50-784(-)
MTKSIAIVGRRLSITSTIISNFASPAGKHALFRKASLPEGEKVTKEVPDAPVTLSQISFLSPDVRSLVESNDQLLDEYRRLQLLVAVLLRLGCCDYSRLVALNTISGTVAPEVSTPKLLKTLEKGYDRVTKLAQGKDGCSCGASALGKYADLYHCWWSSAYYTSGHDILDTLLVDLNKHVPSLRAYHTCSSRRISLELSDTEEGQVKMSSSPLGDVSGNMKARAVGWSGKLLRLPRASLAANYA